MKGLKDQLSKNRKPKLSMVRVGTCACNRTPSWLGLKLIFECILSKQ